MWLSGCWRRGIDRNITPSVNFEAVLVQLARDLGLVSLATLVPDSTKVRAHTSDQCQLPCSLDAVQADYGYTPNRLLANAGYRNERDLQELETRGIDGYVAATWRRAGRGTLRHGGVLGARPPGACRPNWIPPLPGPPQTAPAPCTPTRRTCHRSMRSALPKDPA